MPPIGRKHGKQVQCPCCEQAARCRYRCKSSASQTGLYHMGLTHLCPASTLCFFSSPLADTKATSFMASHLQGMNTDNTNRKTMLRTAGRGFCKKRWDLEDPLNMVSTGAIKTHAEKIVYGVGDFLRSSQLNTALGTLCGSSWGGWLLFSPYIRAF